MLNSHAPKRFPSSDPDAIVSKKKKMNVSVFHLSDSSSSNSSGSDEGDEEWPPWRKTAVAALPERFLAPLSPEEAELHHQPQEPPQEAERDSAIEARTPNAKAPTVGPCGSNGSHSNSALPHPLEIKFFGMKTKYDNGTRIGQDLLFDAQNHIHKKATGPDDVSNICFRGSPMGIRCWYDRLPQAVRDKVIGAGFGDFMLTLSNHKTLVNKAVIHALAERWWDTTHTFHLPCGEFTLSPLHFSAITGLQVGGERIPFDSSIRKRPEDIRRLLGFLPSGYAKGQVPYDQLRKEAMDRRCETEEQIEQCTRCFLLCVIGASILAFNNNRVDMFILSSLCDVNAISRYDWGGAALSTLYANLDSFTRGVRRGFDGLYQVLEIWAYEIRLIRAPMVNPSDDVKAVLKYSTELPAGRRWIGTRIKAESSLKIHPHRLHLNSLEFHMINTNPWGPPKKWPPFMVASKQFERKRILLEGPYARAWYLGERVVEMAWSTEERRIPCDPPASMLCPRELKGNDLIQALRGYDARKFTLETKTTYPEFIKQRLFRWRGSAVVVMHGADSPISAPSTGSQGPEGSSLAHPQNTNQGHSTITKTTGDPPSLALRPLGGLVMAYSLEGKLGPYPVEPGEEETLDRFYFQTPDLVPVNEVNKLLRQHAGLMTFIHGHTKQMSEQHKAMLEQKQNEIENLQRELGEARTKISKTRRILR